MDAVQLIGALLGISGAFLVTSRKKEIRCMAFLLWIFSNVLIGAAYIKLEAWPLLGMVTVYFGTSVFGLWNNRPDWMRHAP